MQQIITDKNRVVVLMGNESEKDSAENGQDGMKKKRFGKDGNDLVIKVPPGTVVIEAESGKVMKDLLNDGESFVAAKGGSVDRKSVV